LEEADEGEVPVAAMCRARVLSIEDLLYLQLLQPQSHRKCLYLTSQNFSP